MLKDDMDLSTIDFAGALSKAGGRELHILLMGSAGKVSSINFVLRKHSTTNRSNKPQISRLIFHQQN